MAVEIEQFMCRTDNFGVLMHDPESGETVIIDAPEAAPILAAIERTGWRPTALWITHHHGDHVAANLALKQKFGFPSSARAPRRRRSPASTKRWAEATACSSAPRRSR